jgi:hypothetical protein
VRLWAVCMKVRIEVCGYGLPVCISGYGSECMGLLYLCQDRGMRIGFCLYLGQDGGVKIWADCI